MNPDNCGDFNLMLITSDVSAGCSGLQPPASKHCYFCLLHDTTGKIHSKMSTHTFEMHFFEHFRAFFNLIESHCFGRFNNSGDDVKLARRSFVEDRKE